MQHADLFGSFVCLLCLNYLLSVSVAQGIEPRLI
jgi:hypothetical protein